MGALDPMTSDGNRFVALAVCAFTKYVEAARNFKKLKIIP